MPDIPYSPRAADGRSYPVPTNPRQADYQSGFTVQRILDMAMSFIGTPYVWGGTTPAGFDCSGIIQYAYGKLGIKLPRVSRDQANAGRRVSARDARPGDLIAFDYSSARAGIDHIGIYLGGGKMLHAPRTGRNVEVVSVNLGRAAAITRVAADGAFTSLRSPTGQYVYTRGLATPPVSTAGPSRGGNAAGGGDPGSRPTRSGGPMSVEDAFSGMGIFGSGTGPNGAYRLEDYGFSNAFFSSDPDLRGLVDRAVAEQWTPERFAIELRNTNWYRARSEAQRNWTVLTTGDPATAQRQRALRHAELDAMMNQMGARLTGAQMSDLIEKSLMFGYSSVEIQRSLAAYVKMSKDGSMLGQAGVTLQELRKLALDYGIQPSNTSLEQWVQRIAKSEGTLKDFENGLKNQAKALYPKLAASIDAGVSVAEIAENYKQAMANILEIDTEAIDFRKDAHLRKALAGNTSDPKAMGPMALYEFERMLRDDPRWRKTSNARSQLSAVTNKVMQDFGLGV